MGTYRRKTGKQHNRCRTPEWRAWRDMLARCRNPNDKHFKDYGGRGIKVCERWENSFSNFLDDLGLRPSLLHSLDRENNDGHYEPSNCRWATKKQQIRNTRSSKLTENDVIAIRKMIGEGHLQRKIAVQFGVDRSTISHIKIGSYWLADQHL